MEATSKRRLLVLITNRFALINLVHTGFLQRIGHTQQISLISDLIRKREIDLINEYFNSSISLWNVPIPREPHFLRSLRLIEKVLFFISFDTSTTRIKLMQLALPLRLFITFPSKIPGVPLFSSLILSWVRKVTIAVSSRCFRINDNYESIDAILSSSPLDIRENCIVNSFVRHRPVPAIGVVISWDNLTSKGIINCDFDQLIVWNGQMKDEFETLYSFSTRKPRIKVAGVPRFDIYFQKLKAGIFPHTKAGTILFATSAPRLFHNQIQIAEDLLEYMLTQKNTSLIIRCHPADDPQNYDMLSGAANVTIWPHPHLPQQVADFPPLDFLEVLADMLFTCDVCVQVASTMRLDAAVCNKPVISIAYDGKVDLPYRQSVRRLYDYSHQIPLNHLRLDHPVSSKQELFNTLDRLLLKDRSETDQPSAVQRIIHYTDAKSVDSMVQCVSEWLG